MRTIVRNPLGYHGRLLSPPKDPEAELLRSLWIAIARGVHRVGEILPPPDVLAREHRLAPKKVEAAYMALGEARLAAFMDGHGYMIEAGAADRARKLLLEALTESVSQAVHVLSSSGCSLEEIEAALWRAKR